MLWPRRRRFSRRGRPIVSVVVNTLDRCQSLRRTLEALDGQSYPHVEVIVVEGPSTDGTGEMLDALDMDVRRVPCGEPRLGLSRNLGLAAASGELLAFTDDDAVPPPEWLERMVAGLTGPGGATAVGGPVFDVPLDRIAWSLCTCTRLGEPDTDSAGPLERHLAPGSDPFPYFAGCNMAFRREAVLEVGGFNEALLYCYDDVDVCCRLVDAGHRLAFVEEATVVHARAASAMRGADTQPVDPYAMVHDRAVFISTCAHGRPAADVASTLERVAEHWVSEARAKVDAGVLSVAEGEHFGERARAGARDGLRDASLQAPQGAGS